MSADMQTDTDQRLQEANERANAQARNAESSQISIQILEASVKDLEHKKGHLRKENAQLKDEMSATTQAKEFT